MKSGLIIRNATFKNASFGYLRLQTTNDFAPDGTKGGVIYGHGWGTGYQQLIFKDHEQADKWWRQEQKRMMNSNS